MHPTIVAVTQANFESLVTSREFLILRLESVYPQIDPRLIDYLEGSYPGKASYGTLEPSSIPISIWWENRFSSCLGKLKYPSEVQAGYYVFHRGKINSWHSGQPPAAVLQTTDRSGLGIFLNCLEILDANSDDKRIDTVSRFLDKAMRSGSIEQKATTASSPQTTGHAESDPFKFLAVAHSATNADIKKAYRARMAESHPDKVAHLSARLREAAAQETIAIQLAFDTIRKKRPGNW